MTTVAEVENADAGNDNLENFTIIEFHTFVLSKRLTLFKYFLIGLLLGDQLCWFTAQRTV